MGEGGHCSHLAYRQPRTSDKEISMCSEYYEKEKRGEGRGKWECEAVGILLHLGQRFPNFDYLNSFYNFCHINIPSVLLFTSYFFL